MHPSHVVNKRPNHPATIMASTGETISYAEMEARANQTAHYFRDIGLKQGDVIALCMDNNSARLFDIAWAAQRAGLYFTCISTKLKTEEVLYILRDSEAKILFGSPSLSEILKPIPTLHDACKYMSVGGDILGYENYEANISSYSTELITDGTAGSDMLYSSGTTGRPKGIKPPLTGGPIDETGPMSFFLRDVFGMHEDSRYLSPAPLYHAAPLRWCMSVHRMGGTAIVMNKWDDELCLELIEKYKIDSVQFVPTHFVRLLKLPENTRNKFDVSSLKTVVHAAAPCPVEIKEKMFDWFGPIIHEYYSGTEGPGLCYIGPQDWLTHKGSVGKSILGTLKICDENGEEVEQGQQGGVYFAGGPKIAYHNAPDKAAEATNKHGWGTMGDIGWVDEDGFLYLTDRKSFTIITGGVNVYPQEIENTIISHPDVMDVAVIGAPDPDFGEKVLAVVQLVDHSKASDQLAKEILDFTEDRLSKIKTPKQLDFKLELPRHPNGKLYKRLLRDEYWNRKTSGIVASN